MWLEIRTGFPRLLLAKALDSGTAFEIVSIDNRRMWDVGENIGAKLQAEQAGCGQAGGAGKGEVRRAAAVAVEAGDAARTQEMRAKVVEAGIAGAEADGRGVPERQHGHMD